MIEPYYMKKWYTNRIFIGLLGVLAYISYVINIPIGMIVFGLAVIILEIIRWNNNHKKKIYKDVNVGEGVA